MKSSLCHINDIQPGDVVFHNGAIRTVGRNDIKQSQLMGVSIFGDCYELGTKLVEKIVSESLSWSTKR